MRVFRSFAVLGWLVVGAADGFAQGEPRPAPAVEVTGGFAGFVDESTIGHGLIGGAARFHLTPRISVGPEFTFMIGPGEDRDLVLTGNLTFDVLPPEQKVTPFFVVGGGLFRHSNTIFGRSFSSTEGSFTGGGGVRGWVSDRVYLASEFRLGWELHYRITGTVGIALSR